jgi:hypothetical protein
LSKGRQYYWPAVAGCAAFIFYLSSMPDPEALIPLLLVSQGDKVGHFMAYGVLTLLLFLAFRYSSGPGAAEYPTVLTTLASSSFGLLCEWYQFYLPFRSADVGDLLANAFGSFFVIVMTRYLHGPQVALS